MAKHFVSVEALEKYYRKAVGECGEITWRITQSPCWYYIQAVEYSGMSAPITVGTYKTDNWNEVVDFCATHCNPRYDFLFGLGCTEQELVDATTKYIHSIGEEIRYVI